MLMSDWQVQEMLLLDDPKLSLMDEEDAAEGDEAATSERPRKQPRQVAESESGRSQSGAIGLRELLRGAF